MESSLDPNKTIAILIGTTEFVDFNNIYAVENNLNEFAKVLADKNIFGLLPKENIKIIKNQTNEEVELKLIEYTENAKAEGINTLIIYFAGHGFRNREGYYFLATKNSRKKLIRTSGNSAIAYDTVKQIIKSSKIPKAIVFIDACYSGTVAQGESKQIFKEYQAKGTYTLTSSDSIELSYFDSDEKHTIFTGELLNIFKNGISDTEKENVSLDKLYEELQIAVKNKNPKMSPQQLASKEIRANNFIFFKNTNYDKYAIFQKRINEQIINADSFFEQGNYNDAKLLYYEAKELKDTDELNEKIKKCNEYIDIVKKQKSNTIIEPEIKKNFIQQDKKKSSNYLIEEKIDYQRKEDKINSEHKNTQQKITYSKITPSNKNVISNLYNMAGGFFWYNSDCIICFCNIRSITNAGWIVICND